MRTEYRIRLVIGLCIAYLSAHIIAYWINSTY